MALGKFPHEVREQMPVEDFDEVSGHLVAENQAQAVPGKPPAPKPQRPKTMG